MVHQEQAASVADDDDDAGKAAKIEKQEDDDAAPCRRNNRRVSVKATAANRASVALGNVKVVTLDDLEPLNATMMFLSSAKKIDEKNGEDNNTQGKDGHDDGCCCGENVGELRILVTVHTQKPCFGSLYVKGLGMWVGYILQKVRSEKGALSSLRKRKVYVGQTRRPRVLLTQEVFP